MEVYLKLLITAEVTRTYRTHLKKEHKMALSERKKNLIIAYWKTGKFKSHYAAAKDSQEAFRGYATIKCLHSRAWGKILQCIKDVKPRREMSRRTNSQRMY